MSKFWTRFLWIVVFLYFAGMLVIWLLPEKVDPNAATETEQQAVQAKVLAAQPEFPLVHLDKAQVKPNRVLAVFATWVGPQPYLMKNRAGWNSEACKIAVVLGAKYVPIEWHVNVAVYYKGLPRGIFGVPASGAAETVCTVPEVEEGEVGGL